MYASVNYTFGVYVMIHSTWPRPPGLRVHIVDVVDNMTCSHNTAPTAAV